MYRIAIVFIATLFLVSPAISADKPAYESCASLATFASLDCKNKESVITALNDLHACMKSRFTYQEKVYAEAWPALNIPDSGPIVGGDGEWAVGCLKFWPCKEKRLAFIEDSGGEPYLVMVSDEYIVDYKLDKVYSREQLPKHRVLKVSGLKKDEPWFKVD